MHENAKVVREAAEAFQRGDLEAFVPHLHDGFEIHMAGNHRFGGTHSKDAFLGTVIPGIMEVTAGTVRLDIHDIFGSDEHVCGLYTFTASRDGTEHSWRHMNAYHVEDGRIREVFWNPFDADVVAAVLA